MNTTLTVLIIYLGILVALAVWSRRETHTLSGFYLAGKKLPYWVVAFSTNATGESGWLLLGLSGMGYLVGTQAYWVVVGEILGIGASWWLMSRRLKALGDETESITVPDVLAAKFEDRWNLIRAVAVLIIVVMVTTYVTAQMVATGKAFSEFLGMDYRTGVVVGSIYAGVATPTEAASVGVCFALLLAYWNKALNFTMLREAFEGTMRTTAMIMLIILAAVFLNFILGFMGVTQALIQFIDDLGLTPLQTMILIVIFYLILGMFMETLSMLLTTVPIIFPLITKLGYDGVWFGILITVLMEAALITPPIGVNLYVVHGIRARGGQFNDVAYGAMPFVVMMIAMVALLIAFPQIALYLPTLVYR